MVDIDIDLSAFFVEEAPEDSENEKIKCVNYLNNGWCALDISGDYKFNIDGLSRWQQLELPEMPKGCKQLYKFGDMRSGYQYIPSTIDSLQKFVIVFVVIHGSLVGKSTPSYYDPYNKDHQNFRHIMRFAAQYATERQRKLNLFTFSWNGIPEQTNLKIASIALTDYLERFYKNENIVLLSHSHGCTIANLVSQGISNPIDLMIHFACPVSEPDKSFHNKTMREISQSFLNRLKQDGILQFYKAPIRFVYNLADTVGDTSPDKFHELVYFYSIDDKVVPFASFNKGIAISAGFNYFLIKKCETFMQQKISKIDPSRGMIHRFIHTYCSKALEFPINPAKYENCKEAVTRIYNNYMNSYIFKLQKKKTIVGVHTRFNNKNAKHDNIIDSASFLTEIFYIFEKNYPIYFSGSSTFDLYAYTEAQEMYLTLREARIQPNCNLSPQGKKRVRGRSYSQTDKEDSYNNKQMQSCKHKRKDDLMSSNSDVIKRKKGCIIQ